MKLYRITFTGRVRGAIGTVRTYTVQVQAESAEAAHVQLYSQYDQVFIQHVEIVDASPA